MLARGHNVFYSLILFLHSHDMWALMAKAILLKFQNGKKRINKELLNFDEPFKIGHRP